MNLGTIFATTELNSFLQSKNESETLQTLDLQLPVLCLNCQRVSVVVSDSTVILVSANRLDRCCPTAHTDLINEIQTQRKRKNKT